MAAMLWASGLRAQTLPGDCDGNDQVSVDEVVLGVNVALGVAPLDACRAADVNSDGTVTVNEIIRSIHEGLGFIVTKGGACSEPGPSGLPAPGLANCDAGTPVHLQRCVQRNDCLRGGDTATLQDDAVGSDGDFSLAANSNEVRGQVLIIEAEVGGGPSTFRTMDFGSLGGFGAALGRTNGTRAAVASSISLSPMSEAAVRLIDENGLENYVDAGIPMIIAATEMANAETNFAALATEESVAVAMDAARVDEGVNDELQTNRFLVKDIRQIGDLQPAGDTDLYGISLAQSAEILVEAVVEQGGLEPCLELRTAANEPLSEVQCGSPARLVRQLDKGTYLVVVSDAGNDGVGTYGVLWTDHIETPTATVTPQIPTATPTATSTPTSTATFTPTVATSTPTPTPTASPSPGSFDVDSTADTSDANPGDGACSDASGECTLRAAIEESNASGVPHIIHIPAGTYTLSMGIALAIQGELTLEGAGMDETIIQAADAPKVTSFGVFDILAGVVNISGVTLRNGRRTDSGGALQIRQGATVSLAQSLLTQNVDAIVTAGTLTVTDSRIEAGTDGDFGDGLTNSGTLVFLRSSVSPGGGLSNGILNTEAGTLTFIDSEASGGLSGIFNELMAAATLTDSSLLGNGFGIYNLGVATLERCLVEGNTTRPGDAGAGVISSGVLDMVDTIVRDNTASDGGGIRNTGMATLRNCTVAGNKTSGVGGTGNGGGILNSGTLEMANCTISGNQALTGSGGGLLNSGGGSATLRNCTVSGNAASIGGGVAVVSGGVVLANTIAAGNESPGGSDCSGAPTSLGFNLIGDASGCDLAAGEGDLVGSAESPIDPLLGPLLNNNGPTPTRALAFGSPAIDAGNPAAPGGGGNTCELTDQRGISRPQGNACDIGAYEALAFKP